MKMFVIWILFFISVLIGFVAFYLTSEVFFSEKAIVPPNMDVITEDIKQDPSDNLDLGYYPFLVFFDGIMRGRIE